MLGAIIGDIVGSPYEYSRIKTKEFPLFSKESRFTDDTIMTVAVAEALMNGGTADDFIDSMKKFGRLYPSPKGGYGGSFGAWLRSDDRGPYNSFGNGSAMRVAPCAWFAKSLEEAEAFAERSAAVTHSHPEGVKGAKATAGAIYLIRTGEIASGASAMDIERVVRDDFQAKVQAGTEPHLQTMTAEGPAASLQGEQCPGYSDEEQRNIAAWWGSSKYYEAARMNRIKEHRAMLREYLGSRYGYDLSRTLDDIRPEYQFNETCQGTVPEAIIAFLESEGFEDAIRNAVSLGGDSDTLAAIAGGIAEAEYGIHYHTLMEALGRLDDNLLSVINAWLDKGLPVGAAMVKDCGPLDYHRWEPKDLSKPHTIKMVEAKKKTKYYSPLYERYFDNYDEYQAFHIYSKYLSPRAKFLGVKDSRHPEVRSIIRFLGDNPGYLEVLLAKYGSQLDRQEYEKKYGVKVYDPKPAHQQGADSTPFDPIVNRSNTEVVSQDEHQLYQEKLLLDIYKKHMAPGLSEEEMNPMDSDTRGWIRCLGDNPGYLAILLKKYKDELN